MILQSGDFEKSIDVLGHFYKWFFSLILQKQWLYLRHCVQLSIALDGFIGTHIEFSLESVLLQLRLARWSQATVKLEGLCIAQGEALHVACFAATTLDGWSPVTQRITGPPQLPAQWTRAWNIFDHLFASCSYSKQVWFGILGHANLHISPQTIDWWDHLHPSGDKQHNGTSRGCWRSLIKR